MVISVEHGFIYLIIQYGIGILLLALIIRAIASWFRMDERYAFIRLLAKITDPFILPIRRLVPPIGMFYVAFILAFFLLITLQTLLLQALPAGREQSTIRINVRVIPRSKKNEVGWENDALKVPLTAPPVDGGAD